MKKGVQQIMLGTVTGTYDRTLSVLERIRNAGYDGVELNRYMIHPTPLFVYCVGKTKSVEEIAEHLSLSNSTYLRNILKGLEDKGFLTSFKRGRTKYYSTDVNALD